MNPKNHARAVRYRKLALTEPNEARATLLLTIAEEAERDVLCTVDSTNLGYARRDEQGFRPNRRSCRSKRIQATSAPSLAPLSLRKESRRADPAAFPLEPPADRLASTF
jgi:hypothetical protein